MGCFGSKDSGSANSLDELQDLARTALDKADQHQKDAAEDTGASADGKHEEAANKVKELAELVKNHVSGAKDASADEKKSNLEKIVQLASEAKNAISQQEETATSDKTKENASELKSLVDKLESVAQKFK